jgi:hypothetical protein
MIITYKISDLTGKANKCQHILYERKWTQSVPQRKLFKFLMEIQIIKKEELLSDTAWMRIDNNPIPHKYLQNKNVTNL